MLTSGDVVEADLGTPAGREAGFRHPAVVVTAQRILDASPSVMFIVPLTSTVRGFDSEVVIDADGGTGLQYRSAAQCQHLRSVSGSRLSDSVGNVGPERLHQIREILATLLDLPG